METPAVENPKLTSEALDRHLVKSVAWTAFAKASSQVVSWACFVVVARLVGVADYGLITMSNAFIGFVAILGEAGIGATVINVRALTDRQLRQLNGLSLLLGLGALVLSVLMAYPLSLFFRAPQLVGLLPVMGLGFPLSGLRGVPQALMQRKLEYKLISSIEAVQAVVQALVALAIALAGGGYWALVIASLAGSAFGCVAMLRWHHPGLAVPRRETLGDTLGFTRRIAISNIAWYAYSTSDFVVAGRTLGKGALGAYSMAWTLALLPVDKLVSLIMRVMPGFLSNAQTDKAAVRRYIYKVTEAVALVTFPAAAGMGLLAGDFIPLLLGREWSGAILPLTLLSAYGAIYSVSAILPHAMNALGNPSVAMWSSILRLIGLVPGFWFASRWGAPGIAAAWVVLYPLLSVPLYVGAFRGAQLHWRDYVKCLLPGLNCAVAMSIAIVAVAAALPADLPVWIRLTLKSVAAGAGGALILLVLHRDRLNAFYGLVRGGRAKR